MIDLTNQPNTSMEITLNVTISSDSDDYGVSIITTSPDAPKYDASITEYFIKESGSVTRTEEYTTTIEGGKKYYLHIGYKKDLRLAYGMDTFLINSLRVKSDNLTENLNFYNYNKNGNVVTFNLNNHLEKNIYIRAVYTDGNTSKYGSKTLINIDKIAPIIGSAKAILISREEGKIETKVFEEGSGVKGYYISTDEEAPTEKSNWIPQTMDEFTIENLKANTTYYLWVIDNVGFISLGRKVQLGIANYLVDDKIGTETLEEAIAVSSNGSEIKLLSDYTDTSTAEFNKNVIFDVQNYTLTKSNQIVISSGKNVEITGTGKITSSYSTGNTIRNDAKLAVKDNVTIEYTGTSTIYAPIDNNTGSSVININDNAHIIGYNTGIRNEYGVVNINGGCIEATNLKSSAKGINNLNAAKIYLNAGEVKGYYGIYITNNSVVDMRGGKVVGIGANGIYGGGTINIYDGRIEGKTYGIYATATDKLTIGREEDTLSTTNPAIYGGSYGVYMNSSYNFNFFNGVLITNTKENIYRGNIKLRTNHTLYTYFDYNIEQKYCTILTPIVEEIKMEANPTEYTNKDVTVKITYPDRNYTMQYSEDSKNWVDASDYIQELVVTENKIIYARIINESGFVEDEKQIEINNIDKENPVIEVSPDETNYVLTSSNGTIDLTIDIKAFDSGVSGLDIVQYAWAKNGEEVKYEDFDSTGKTITQKNLGEGQYNLYFYVTDRAGNEADLQQIRYNVKFGDPVCKIGDITYTTIQAAIDTCSKNAGNTQTTIEMLKNTDEEFEIFAGQNIILDLKGYTIGTSSLDIPLCTNNGQIQIIDSSEEKTGKLESLNGKTIENNGTFTLGDSNTGIEMEVPTIYGYKIGIENNNLFNFYDGKIQGITPIKGNATDMPKDYGTVSTKFENGITTVQLGIVTGYEARIDWVYYTTLIEAIDAANTYKNVSEVTITILKDIQLNETLNISGKNDIVLDLNGYMLTVAPQNDTIIKNYSNLEIMDNSIEQAGNLTITTTSLDYIYAIRNEGEGTLKISSGIIKSCSTKKDGNNYAIYNYSTGTVIMNGGTINSNDSGEDVDSYGIYNYNAGNVIIEGGTINCISSTSNSCGIYNNRKGNLNFLEGNLNVSSADYNDCYGIRNSGIFSMKGGNITAEYSDGFSSSIYGIYNYGSIEITGGNINVIDSGYEYGIYNSSGGTIIFSEGNINADYRGIHNEGEINIEGGTITGRNYGVYNEGRAVIGKENEILEKDNPKIIATNIIRSIQ